MSAILFYGFMLIFLYLIYFSKLDTLLFVEFVYSNIFTSALFYFVLFREGNSIILQKHFEQVSSC